MPKVTKKKGTLSKAELEIITNSNPNYFTSFFLRSDTSGTYWRPHAKSERWKNGYNTLKKVWRSQGKRQTFNYNNANYTVIDEGNGDYVFHHNHGFLFQPWQLDVHYATQRIQWIIGGYGSGKTLGNLASMLYHAATKPGFNGVILAPAMSMTNSIYNDALLLMQGTKYEEKFLVNHGESPYPKLIIGNDHIGYRNRIMFYPIGDSIGSRKILTMNLDMAMVDQSEQLSDFKEIYKNVGSRMRGMVDGRPRMGLMKFIANADFNDEMWIEASKEDEDPKRYKTFIPTTWDNPFITDDQLQEIEKDVGGDEESINVHMRGQRPLGSGEHFNAQMIRKARSTLLTELMKKAIENDEPGYEYERVNNAGIVSWALPPQDGHLYAVFADPGYDNPPRRNAPCVMVFDYTNFPEEPAQCVGFFWVYGNNDPWPWISKHLECVNKYRAWDSNGIDSTGIQSFYHRVIAAIEKANVMPMSLSGNFKFSYLNLAKSMMSKGLIVFPSEISGIFMQLARYKLPDKNLAQDIVMTILLAAGWLEDMFYISKQDEESEPEPVASDRFDRARFDDRYGRSNNDR